MALKRGALSYVFDLVFGSKKARPSAKKIEDGSENPFEIVSEVMGPDFALQASTNPVLLQQSQILVDTFSTQVEQRLTTLNDKLQLAATLGRGFQQELFHTKVSSNAQMLISMSKDQGLTGALWRARMGLEIQATIYPINLMQSTFVDENAVTGLQAILDASRDVHTKLVPVLRSFALVLGVDSFSNSASFNSVINHPALLAAYEALAAYNDDIICSAAADTILAAVNLSSCIGTAAQGAQGLADYLFEKASSLAPVMQNYLALASNGDFTYQPQAAAHAKMLAGIATAYINPLAGFLEVEDNTQRLKNAELIAAMAAMRCYPLPDVAQESVLFWRILMDSRKTALAWASELRLPEAACLAAFIRLPYTYLLEALNNRALLPESLWGSMSAEQQAMLAQCRNQTLEPLLETAEVMGLKQCVDELVGSWARRQGSCLWSHHDALLACINVLHRASPPVDQDTGSLRAVFENLPDLPRVGSLPATAAETIYLYTPWAAALATEKPEEGRLVLDAFSAFLASGEVEAPAAAEVISAPVAEEPTEAKPAQSNSESELASESTSPCSTEPQSEASSLWGEDEAAPQAASLTGDADTHSPEAVWDFLAEGWYAAEDPEGLQGQEDDASSEGSQQEGEADAGYAQYELEVQQEGIYAAEDPEGLQGQEDDASSEASQQEGEADAGYAQYELGVQQEGINAAEDAEALQGRQEAAYYEASQGESEADVIYAEYELEAQQGLHQHDIPAEEALEGVVSTATEPSEVVYQESSLHTPAAAAMAGQSTPNTQDDSGIAAEGGRPQLAPHASEPSSTVPGTLLGKLYWAAGAVVGMVQGFVSILKCMLSWT